MGLFNRKQTPQGFAESQPLQVVNLVATDENTDPRRPCWARGKKALFHRWCNSAHPVAPRGAVINEHTRYFQFRSTTALVEYEDGTMGRVYTDEIQFADGGNFDAYEWREAETGQAGGAQGVHTE